MTAVLPIRYLECIGWIRSHVLPGLARDGLGVVCLFGVARHVERVGPAVAFLGDIGRGQGPFERQLLPQYWSGCPFHEAGQGQSGLRQGATVSGGRVNGTKWRASLQSPVDYSI